MQYIYYMTQIWWGKNWKGRGKREEKKKEKVGARVGEARTRALSLAKTALQPIAPPSLERKVSSKRAYIAMAIKKMPY